MWLQRRGGSTAIDRTNEHDSTSMQPAHDGRFKMSGAPKTGQLIKHFLAVFPDVVGQLSRRAMKADFACPWLKQRRRAAKERQTCQEESVGRQS